VASALQVISMNKQEFIDRLSTKDNLSDSDKIEICQYYIDNYPVALQAIGGVTWTKLDVQINRGSDKAINFAYNSLRRRLKEFTNE